MEDIQEHLMTCHECGEQFDMRDLSQVFYHEEVNHKPISYNSVAWYELDKIIGEKQ
jgi:hypothetical protein